jgi:hypothetical protein
MSTLSAPPGSLNFSTDSVAILYSLLPFRLLECDVCLESPIAEEGTSLAC